MSPDHKNVICKINVRFIPCTKKEENNKMNKNQIEEFDLLSKDLKLNVAHLIAVISVVSAIERQGNCYLVGDYNG